MSINYLNDRNWSDTIFYENGYEEFLYLLNKSTLFKKIKMYKGASKELDNIYCIDTIINNITCQVRIQRSENQKYSDYRPTIRENRKEGVKRLSLPLNIIVHMILLYIK